LISDKLRGLNEKWLEYLIHELFSNRKCHGLGPWLVDQRRATEARRKGGDGTGTTRRDRETTHPSPDDGEEVAH
jgi:hypothetical protein